MTETYNNIPFFFIIGRPRSGTTLLQSLFDAHPNVIIPPESPVIVNLFNRYGKSSKVESFMPEKLISDLKSIRKFSMWPIDEIRLKSELQNFNGNFQELIKTVYSSYKSPFTKNNINIFGDKNPIYSLFLKKITRIIPDAKIIYIIRDYRDHILSTKRVKLLLESTTIIAYRWKKSLIAINKLKTKYPDKFFTIRYEDFVENPVTEMKKMCEFLNIDFFPDVFDYYKKEPVFYDKMNREAFDLFHSALLKPINNSAVGKWKSSLSKKDIQTADYICRKKSTLYGYQPEYLKTNIKIFLHVLPRIIYIKLQEILGFLIEFLPFRINMKIRGKRPFLTSIFLKIFMPKKYKKLVS
ncbi:MAG: sulfotransferase [Bacteroidota bacterium]